MNNALTKITKELMDCCKYPTGYANHEVIALAFTAGAKAHRDKTRLTDNEISKLGVVDNVAVSFFSAERKQKEKSRLFFKKLKKEQ